MNMGLSHGLDQTSTKVPDSFPDWNPIMKARSSTSQGHHLEGINGTTHLQEWRSLFPRNPDPASVAATIVFAIFLVRFGRWPGFCSFPRSSSNLGRGSARESIQAITGPESSDIGGGEEEKSTWKGRSRPRSNRNASPTHLLQRILQGSPIFQGQFFCNGGHEDPEEQMLHWEEPFEDPRWRLNLKKHTSLKFPAMAGNGWWWTAAGHILPP